jgi:hypothetical protein
MAPEVMAARSPRARLLGAAYLPGYRLAFTRRSIRTHSGVADLDAQAAAGATAAVDGSASVPERSIAIRTAAQPAAPARAKAATGPA